MGGISARVRHESELRGQETLTQAGEERLSAKNLLLASWISFWAAVGAIVVGAYIEVAFQLDVGLYWSVTGFVGLGLAGMLMTIAVDRSRH